MHTTNLDLSLNEITKIEGAASLELKIRQGKVEECKFIIAEYKRFYTQAIRGKPISAVPQLVARICGTCSNAHLLCNIKALENALDIKPSTQTQILRQLLNYGLIIRDHGLHLYVFVLPDLFNKNSILDFDEKDPVQHQLLHDCFAVKQAGNMLSMATGGRSVHAPFAAIGGFSQLPTKDNLLKVISFLKNVRPQVLHLIDVFSNCNFNFKQNFEYMALVDNKYSFLTGMVKNSNGNSINTDQFGQYLEKVVMPYSHAAGYRFQGKIHQVGALARINLNQPSLHPRTQKDTVRALAKFPSNNVFHNNLAQAIEILHAIDSSIDLISQYQAVSEKPVSLTFSNSPSSPSITGVGVIEAPRGTLYHKLTVIDGKVADAQIVVPTNHNQIPIVIAIRDYVSQNLDKPKEELTTEIEKLIRAFDPCMSCASHFLKVRWK